MSDFIARIAARAVGTPPVAQPRLPAFFGGDAAAPEIADERVALPPERSEQPRRVQTTTRVQAAPAVEAPAVVTVTERVEAAPPPATVVRETVSSVEHTIHEREVAAPVPAAPLPQAVDEAARAEPALAVHATPVVVEAVAQAPGGPAPATRTAEPPPVRVHIGRLEVRANLQQAPPPQPQREAPRPQGLTLADYLRGKREAG